MSAISSISGLSQFYQSVSVSGVAQQTDDADATTAVDASTATDASSQVSSTGTEAPAVQPHHHHGGGHGGGEFFKKLQSAITSALQSSQADDSSDPNQVVEDAITSVLQGKSDPSTANGSNPTATPTDSSETQPAASATDDGSSGRQAFFQALKSYGIDPQQFHSDFLAAVQNAKSGQADPSSVFQSFPPGTLVDATG